MVKGVSRRVIVVKSPDPRLFEQAIFIVKEEAMQGGVTAEGVLAEARKVANGYVRKNSTLGKALSHLPPAAWAGAGALVASGLWGLAIFLGI